MKKYNIEDKHEIASIIYHCLEDGCCDTSMLARRIAQAGYGNNNRVRNEFAEKLKKIVFEQGNPYNVPYEEFSQANVLFMVIDDMLKEYENDN